MSLYNSIGGYLQLTYPETKEYDTVFPGENWFFFWRTSPSLWESKLSEYQGPQPIFVPIFWGLHSENPQQADFGSFRPETDLKKLYQAAQSAGKEIVFVIPLTPAPFLPNGGLPPYLARTMSIDKNGLGIACVDNDGRLNKCYSFFDPRVFQGFREFTAKLGRYFSEQAVGCEIYGVDCQFIENGRGVSYFDDTSAAFERGFARYVNQINLEGERELPSPDDSEKIEELKNEYAAQIKALYRQSAEETLAASWSGVIKAGFIGGAPSDIINRSSDSLEHVGDFFEPLFQSLTLDILPCSALLSPKVKKAPLVKALADIVSESLIRGSLGNELYEEDYSSSFYPSYHFELINSEDSEKTFEKVGLMSFLNREYPWTFRMRQSFEGENQDEENGKTHFFIGKKMDQKLFGKMIRLLLNGSTCFLDTSFISEEIEKRLNLFVVENDLNVEKLNYICPISRIKLGEGSIVTYESEKLSEASLIKQLNFWETMTSYLKIKRLKVESEAGVYHFWNSRASNAYELNYEEIRRANLYNTTSYKKKAKIISAKNFAFVKTVDQKNAEIKSTPIGIEVFLLPGGSVSLDFGFYE